MVKPPTMDAMLRQMKAAAPYIDATSNEEAICEIAEKTVVAEILGSLQEREELSTDIREVGLQELIKRFEARYPTFYSEATPQVRTGVEQISTLTNYA